MSAVLLVGVLVSIAVSVSPAAAETLCIKDIEGLFELQVSPTECSVELSEDDSSWELVTFLLAESLVGGTAVATTLSTVTSGELLLEDKKAILGIKAAVLCSLILDGTIGANGEGEVTELLTLAGVAVSLTALSGTALLCNGQEGCNTGTGNDEVWAVNLPWITQLDLVEFDNHVNIAKLKLPHAGGGLPGWYVQCATALGTADDECTAEESVAETSNLTGGVSNIFSEAATLTVGYTLGNCTASAEKETGNIEGSLEEKSSEGTLADSSVG